MIPPEFTPHIGPALQVVRVFRKLSKAEMAAALCSAESKQVDEDFITRLEQGDYILTETEFERLCAVLNTPRLRVLKMASLMWQQSDLPESEILRRAADEIQYRMWERKQADEAG